MAGEVAAEEIARLGWRQGSVLGHLLVREARGHAPGRINIDESDRLIVTSHDCDIVNPSIKKEPVVEVLRAAVSHTPPDSHLQGGRNPRSLHFTMRAEGRQINLSCNIHERWTIPRQLLANESPLSGLTGKSLRTLVEWLARRYIRAAFPNAFDRRWKTKVKEWEALLRRNSQWIQGVFLRLDTLAELPDGQPYRCHLFVAVPGTMRMGPGWVVEKGRLEVDVSGFWQQFGSGIVCDDVEVLGTDELTLADIEQHQRFDADWVSFDDDSPSTPAIVDMRT